MLRRVASDPHVVLAAGAIGTVVAEYGFRTRGHPYAQRGEKPTFLLLEAAIALAALAYAWRAQDRLRLWPVLGIALGFHLLWLGLHLHLHVPGDQDTDVYRLEGLSLVHGHYPLSEYPPAAVVLFGLEAWLHPSAVHTANGFVLVPFQLATVASVWSLRTRFSAWLAAVLALWPLDAYWWEFRFDLLPAALLVAGLALAWRRRWALAGLALGVGAAAKWSPALAFAALGIWCVAAGERRAAARLSAAFAGGVLAFYVPFLIWSPGQLGYAYTDQSGRPFTGASVWYLPFRVLGQTKPIAKSYGYAGTHWSNAIAIGIQTLLVAAVVLAAVLARRNLGRGVALAAAAPAAFFLTNRIFSPQFLIVLLAVWAVAAALVVETRREQLTIGVAAMTASFANAFVGQFVLWSHDRTWLACSTVVFVLGVAVTWRIVERSLRGELASGRCAPVSPSP